NLPLQGRLRERSTFAERWQQFAQLRTRMKHPRLYRVQGTSNDRGDLLVRPVAEVGQFDDRALLRRELLQGMLDEVAQVDTIVSFHWNVDLFDAVVEIRDFETAGPEPRTLEQLQRLAIRNPPDPGRHFGAPGESRPICPDDEHDVVDALLREIDTPG